MSPRAVLLPAVVAVVGLITGCTGQPGPSTSTPREAATRGASALASATAVIEGRVSFPSEGRPDLQVYAIGVDDPTQWFTVTVPGTETAGHDVDGRYSLPVAPGTYYVLAYPSGDDSWAGLYSRMVPCGLTAACTDHGMLPVSVEAGETATGIDPGDWYYGEGQEFPERPQ
jgi:hypothetical protein